jgi:serine/threonine protein kinase
MNKKYDIFCFGLSLIEMISANMPIPHTLKYICRIIKNGEKQKILQHIDDEDLRDFIRRSIEENPENRSSVEELMSHAFLKKTENDHKGVKISA